MARDCPDRQRGADWRNGPPPAVGGRPTAGRIGGGDAQDREYEALMNELSGNGGAIANGAPQGLLEGGAGVQDNIADVKPWQRGPTGAAAPWKTGGGGPSGGYDRGDSGSARPWASGGGGGRGGDHGGGYDNHRGGRDNYGGGRDNYGGGRDGYGGGGAGGAAPWQQSRGPPAPPAAQQYGGYGQGNGGYDQYQQGGYAPPPPPGYGNQGYGNAGSPPPPPPGSAPPPPPVSNDYSTD